MMHNTNEQITVFTPLGIRFWDPVLSGQVSDGLIVSAWPEKTNRPVTRAFRTSSGIYAFQGLPGLRDIEYPNMDKISSNQTAIFTIEIKDEFRRYLPVVFSINVPHKGIFPTSAGNLLAERVPGFYLFSATTRTLLPGCAVLRGQIVDKSTGHPAAHAVMEIKISNKKWYGVADTHGSIMVQFPYPTITNKIMVSPIGKKVPIPLQQQQWDITVKIYYAPSTLKYPVGADLPEFLMMFNQMQGIIWSTTGQPVSELSLILTYGQEIILHTGGLPETILWIDRVGSPP